jgi:2-dehydro-3-deoxyphosphogluconate aldolase/(4S)-4-hydroxy-2-oxoglutarate aldolase
MSVNVNKRLRPRKRGTLGRIRKLAVIPVLRVPSREQAICAVEGVLKAGLDVLELTLTIPNAIELIEWMRATYGDRLLLGAGTVLDAETCRLAIAAGTDFVVSPVFDSEVLEMAQRIEVPCIPGAMTPTEVVRAWRAGADLVKISPGPAAGGPNYIRALKGPFPEIEVIVTGGVNRENVLDFFAAGATAVGVGERILAREALAHGDVETIASNARLFLDTLNSRRSGARDLRGEQITSGKEPSPAADSIR